MIKTFIALILLWSNIIYSQNEANTWYFGTNAGLDFGSGTPLNLSGGQIDTHEGTAVMSNAAGELLFYTDGITVWNKTHQIMPNGTGLLGHLSSTQSALIVPHPGNSNLFYIFTTDADVSFPSFEPFVIPNI